jgi:signal transduction histidine kinase
VFQPFVRLDESRSVDDGGTGLGLAIVADILRAHGGRAQFVDPPTGAGTALRFTLPAADRLNDWLPPSAGEEHPTAEQGHHA